MEKIPQFTFHKTKYGEELLVDIVRLKNIKKYLTSKSAHKLKYFDITFITKGGGKFCIEDKEYTVKERDILFSQPYQTRTWDIENIADGYALIFEEDFLLSFFNDRNFVSNLSFFNPLKTNEFILSLNRKNYDYLIVLLQNIKDEIENSKKKDKHILRSLLYQILSYVSRIYTEKYAFESEKTSKDYVQQFISLVNNSFEKEHSTSYYAEKICITQNYLNELVKSETNSTAKQIIQDKLFNASKKELLYTSLSIKEVAEKLNFESSSYFIRFFKRKSGVTPSVFRKRIKP